MNTNLLALRIPGGGNWEVGIVWTLFTSLVFHTYLVLSYRFCTSLACIPHKPLGYQSISNVSSIHAV